MSAPQAPQTPVPVGAVIAGKYRVEGVLGAGAMGVVLAARHLDLHELRAIKLMLPSALGNAEGVERFFREARAAARLKSQHAAKVHDTGRLDDGTPYIVMEYLEGADLKAVVDQRGALPAAEAASYVREACEAIGEAHAAGIVHRDLKLANLFLARGPTGGPCVRVLDFGIAKVAAQGEGAGHMTATAAVLGTPLYMSPEQMRGTRDVDARADVWSLGVILYRMLTGKAPFSGGSITEICASVIADTPAPPRALRSDVPPGLEAVILRCLEKDPAQRFASAAELSAALAPFARTAVGPAMSVDTQAAAGRSGTAPWSAPPAPASSAAPAPASSTSSPQGPAGPSPARDPLHAAASTGSAALSSAPRPSRGARLSVALALLGAPVLGGAAAVVLWRSSDDASTQGSAETQPSPPSPAGGMAAPPGVAGAGPVAPSSRGAADPTDDGERARVPAAPSAQLGTSAAPAPSPPATAAPGGAPKPVRSSKSAGAIRGAALGCWKDNEGARPGQAASSASITVSAGPPRSVLVTGPAKAHRSFTSCVVTRGAQMRLDPGEIAQVSVSLPAGPP